MTKVTFRGSDVTTVGSLPAVGDPLPQFQLTDAEMNDFGPADFAGKRIVLNIFPSVDTGVCAASIRRFNELASSLDNTVVICASKDLPFAQARFCGAEGLDNVITGSAFRTSFGEDLGVTLVDGIRKGLLSRAVVVTDENHQVIHAEQVAEMANEPDYEAAVAALQ